MREHDKAVFKTFVNGKCEFKNAISSMPNLSPNSLFNNTLAEILNHLPNVSIKRNTVETIISQIEFDFELEEEFPFTRNLYEDLVSLLKETDIRIVNIEHQRYKERYTLKLKDEVISVDFEYNKKGFWGRVLLNEKRTNSHNLKDKTIKLLTTLKNL
jgi:hypothetical protein